MKYARGRVEGNPKILEVVSLNDWHLGSSACDIDLINRVIEYVKENNTRAIINGDLIENGTKNSVGSGVYEQILTPQEQIDLAIELLEPIKSHIDISVTGNHEQRTMKDLGIDPMKIISDRLGINYVGYRGVVNYAWNKVGYPVMVYHGSHGGKTTATIERRLKEMSNVAEDCLVYLIGHYHRRFVTSKKIYRIDQHNQKARADEVYYVASGSTMNTATYAEMMGLEEQVPCQAVLRFSGDRSNKKIEVDWIE